jgi:uncharacterized protein YukE
MDNFVKHLSGKATVNEALKTKLIADANQLIKAWNGLASN